MLTERVALPGREYEVLCGEGQLALLGREAARVGLSGRCVILTDSNVGSLHGAQALQSLANSGFQAGLITVPAGEKSKCLEQVESVCDQMIAAGLDRKSFLVALGGGVVGDLGGFVSAIYYRGIPYVQVPTTLLAQVDSSVGGKTGVNARGGKNLVGAFHQPKLVIADTSTLSTLPEREFVEGYAEIVKHGMIRDRHLLENVKRLPLPELVARNVAIKAKVVVADEHELSGERAHLNFGHTIGHGIENAAGYGRFLHGEAISLGLVAALRISARKAGLSREELELSLHAIEECGLPMRLSDEVTTPEILAALAKDKKFARGEIRFVLLKSIGSPFLSTDVTIREIEEAIEELRA